MYKRTTQGWMKHIDFILWDVFSLHIAFVIAYFIRQGFDGSPYTDEVYRGMAVMMTLVDILVAIMFNTMHNVLKRGYYLELASTVKHAAIVFGLLTIYLISVQKGEIYSRIVLFMTFGFHVIIGYGIRILWKLYLFKRGIKGFATRSLLIVTDEACASDVINNLINAPDVAFKIAGLILIDRDATGERINDVDVVASIGGTADYICREWVDEVFIKVQRTVERPIEIVEQCREMGVVVHESISLTDGDNVKQFVERIDGYTVLTTSLNYATPLVGGMKSIGEYDKNEAA